MHFVGNIDRTSLSFSLLLAHIFAPALAGLACLSNPCLHGICLDDLNSTYFCYCIDGYTGIQCQTNWNECWSSPCQNGGVCVDGIAAFNCSCAPGFVGDLCEVDFNECESNPCQNNGTCTDDTNGYVCNCHPGYSGEHCEIDVAVCNATNETRCANGGVCQEGPGDAFFCQCQPGWQGELCDLEVDECRSSPCRNGAICEDLLGDYLCICPFGFNGRHCEEKVEICKERNPCKNGALCLVEEQSPTCYCVPDYHGELCEFQYDECQLGPKCLNGGTCIDGIDNSTCSCPPKLTGGRCECLILNDNELDCTYTSPRPSSTEPTTITQQVPKTESTTIEPYTTMSSSSSFSTMQEPSARTIEQETATTSQFVETTTQFIETTTLEDVDVVLTSTFTNQISTETSSIAETTTEDVTIMTTTDEDVQATETTTIFSTSTDRDYLSVLTSSLQTLPPETSTSDVETSTIPFSSTSPEFITLSSSASSHQGREVNTSTSYETTTSIFSITTSELSTLIDDVSSSTTDISSSTSLPPFDCTRTHCQNGGSCVYDPQDGFQCICPFDSEGDYCEIELGVKKAAFTGNSYLKHRLPNAYNISFAFEAKTLAYDGLIFYSVIDNIYMFLYIESGHLKFKFSCGYQTMLLSEITMPINNGNLMKVSTRFNISSDLKRCNASIQINNTLSMTGDQVAKINKLIRPSTWLYLGGVPYENLLNMPENGFMGCMHKLRIEGQFVDIFADAQDGYGVTECLSLACLANPCQNGATCHAQGEAWRCSCKNGYIGENCDKSVCDNNPCLFGGTCIPFAGSGYLCLCPFGKHGHFCENDLKINEPYFATTVRGLSSYVAYPIPGGITDSMELKFRFTPTMMDQISLLMFIGQKGQHDFYSDHMSVSFVKGYIMLTWNLGSGPRRIFTPQPIEKNARSYQVHIGRSGRRAWLSVDNLGNITGRSPGNLVHLDVVPVLFLGGHDSRNFTTLPHDLPLHTGFSGCIFDVVLISGSLTISLQGGRQATGRSVGQCGTSECYEQSCQNGGVCLHHASTFMCMCQDGWFGSMCSSKINPCDSGNHQCVHGATCVPVMFDYECDCPLGKSGKYCQNDEDITDVSLTGSRSYLSLESSEFDANSFDIEFEIRPLDDNGVIFFMERVGVCFVCLSLQNGLLELKLLSSYGKPPNEPVTLTSNRILVKGIWYKVQFGVFGRRAYLSLDNVLSAAVLDSENGLGLSNQPIFIGGVADLSTLPLLATTKLPVPFKGCIRHFSLNSLQIPLTKSNIRNGRNLNDCDGTACGKDACLNGGTCWLDSFKKPHCSCAPPFYGNKCEKLTECNEAKCKNTQGKCLGSKCSCFVGWHGAYCETKIAVTTPQFTGNSYLVVKKNYEKKRDTRTVPIRNLYLNFTTIKKDGLILWSKMGNNFIGVGLENGLLKIAHSLGEHRTDTNNFLSLPLYQHISDGLWHSIEINFQPFSIKLDQNQIMYKGKLKKMMQNEAMLTDGYFYIGGIPTTKSSIWKETNGAFVNAFEGCLDGFATNHEETIRDFTNMEGQNVGICKMT